MSTKRKSWKKHQMEDSVKVTNRSWKPSHWLVADEGSIPLSSSKIIKVLCSTKVVQYTVNVLVIGSSPIVEALIIFIESKLYRIQNTLLRWLSVKSFRFDYDALCQL